MRSRQPCIRGRGSMGAALRSGLARPSGAVRQVQEPASAVQPLVRKRGVGEDLPRTLAGPEEPVPDDRFDDRTGSSAGRDGP